MKTIEQLANNKLTSNANDIGGVVGEYIWKWQERELKISYETVGEGKPLLLLPAFSTVSSKAEWQGFAKLLSPQLPIVTVDWPGFGRSSRPALNYCPDLYHQFLHDFVKYKFDRPITVIAVGHAAGYAIELACNSPDVFNKIILVAPTWRGPLPTMMNKPPEQFKLVKDLVRSPILGQFLYKLNTHPAFLRYMYRRHVYTDAEKLSKKFIEDKWEITQQNDARFGSAAFVTGALDTFKNREELLSKFSCLKVPVTVVIAQQSPPKSKAEMEALAKMPGVQAKVIAGSLGLHEEYPEALAKAIELLS
jgi:pimeloyl-ACP methyl ester carboxylesterase